MKRSVEVRSQLVEIFRRDLVGPSPEPKDADLARERLNEIPSRWYLTGFLAPAEDPQGLAAAPVDDDPTSQEEQEIEGDGPEADGAGGAAGDREPADAPNTRRRFLPSSIGLTVLLPPKVEAVEAVITWGDYRTEPPLPEAVLLPEPVPEEAGPDGKPVRRAAPEVDWIRTPQERSVRLPVPREGRGKPVIVPDSAASQRPGGGLQLEAHARLFRLTRPDGTVEEARAFTVFLVNRRPNTHRRYADVSYVFQARLELVCERSFLPRRDLSGYGTDDEDRRVADLHYRDLAEWAVGRNTAAAWDPADDVIGRVTRVRTDPLPTAEVERVAPNEDAALTDAVTFAMEALAERATGDGTGLAQALAALPELYGAWIEDEQAKIACLDGERRRKTARRLVADMEGARARIQAGIDVLAADATARTAFRFMNEAVARAARRRNAGAQGDPAAQPPPVWRPFQLAFILLNINGLVERTHPDRETADLLFFPTGGGKTEAYLGLAAFVIAHRRLTGLGVLGAGVAVIMRYTLRLLTLDQLARAAGVVCALELMRTDSENLDVHGRRLLGDWPVEIGLWVGSDASPNKLGRKGDPDEATAVGRVRRYRQGKGRAPAPIKACPWCGTPFTKNSFICAPNERAPVNLEIRCANSACEFTGDRALPVLTVDEPIYRRLPAFLIATVDKFASLPWEGRTGAFFGHVDRFQEGVGFYAAAEPVGGHKLDGGWTLEPPELIIQDELHLIAGPLGTVVGLYEAAIDQLATRQRNDCRVRPKIVASTATVRRAAAQIEALFDRHETAIFPPPGIDRTDSFFARTIAASQDPARLYLGIAAQGRGPKLVFLRSLTTIVAAVQALYAAAAPTAKPGAETRPIPS